MKDSTKALLMLIGLGSVGFCGFIYKYDKSIEPKNFNIITKDNIEEDSYVALINGEIKIIQQGKIPEYNIDELTDKVKQYEQKHKHYLDLISKNQYTDTKECYINELVSETITNDDDDGYQYKDIIIMDSLDNYLSEYEKLLMENGKFSDDDIKKLFENITNNEIIINKVEELSKEHPYSLKLKSEN